MRGLCAARVAFIFLLATLSILAGEVAAQQPVTRLRVYLDCQDCFQNYLREEIDWVDYVRQREDADVHLLSTSSPTGAGGREVVLRFVGVGRFVGRDRELRAVSEVAEPEDLRRERVLQTVIVALLGYLAEQGLPANLDVDVGGLSGQARVVSPLNDPWNLWVYRVRGGGSIQAEESTREVRWNISFTGDRVTENWKMSFGASTEQSRETFDLDEDDPFEAERNERTVESFVAKSLGPHWSVGFESRLENSTFDNTKLLVRVAPAVEYSIFPYEEYATRQFVLEYEIGPEYNRYNEITLFDKTEETLWRHEVSARFDQRQPWGTVETGIEWSQYLHDLSKYRLEADGELSVRIARGLSVNMNGSASRIRDQLGLPKRDATEEEVLLRLRELQSGYEIEFSVSVSYSFGSLFNNVVNPRFGVD